MARTTKEFHQRQSQKLFRAIIGQAVTDALEGCEADKRDALDWLFTDRSDLCFMSQGIPDPDSFREKLRDEMTRGTVTLWLEDRKPLTCAGLVERKAA